MEIVRDPTIPAVRLIIPKRHGDERGFFTEVWRNDRATEFGLPLFVQDNHSLSQPIGTIRGLHFQINPQPQAKLVRCIRGRILDVAVDLRRGSPMYGRHVAYELSAKNGHQLYVPVGFAHGFCTLEADTEVTYKVSDYYSPAADKGIRFDDPALQIVWPIKLSDAHLSPKDRALPMLGDLPSYFHYSSLPD